MFALSVDFVSCAAAWHHQLQATHKPALPYLAGVCGDRGHHRELDKGLGCAAGCHNPPHAAMACAAGASRGRGTHPGNAQMPQQQCPRATMLKQSTVTSMPLLPHCRPFSSYKTRGRTLTTSNGVCLLHVLAACLVALPNPCKAPFTRHPLHFVAGGIQPHTLLLGAPWDEGDGLARETTSW